MDNPKPFMLLLSGLILIAFILLSNLLISFVINYNCKEKAFIICGKDDVYYCDKRIVEEKDDTFYIKRITFLVEGGRIEKDSIVFSYNNIIRSDTICVSSFRRIED